MSDYVVVTSKGQALNYEGHVVRFASPADAASWAISGDSIVPFDPAVHRDRPATRSRPGVVHQHDIRA